MALVLSRRAGERIIIGDHIVLEVVEIHPYAIRIGITAPHQVRILREELYEKEKIAKEKEQ